MAERIENLYLSDIDWLFRVYLMRSDPTEHISHDELLVRLAQKVKTVARGLLSHEFSYIRSGFILAHYGRRGVTFALWHWADWEGTWEYFCQAWYCYGRDLDHMELLDRNEPIMCQHEVELIMKETTAFRELLLKYDTQSVLVKQYRDSQPWG